jgi:molecular chaperone GrpE
MDGEDRRGVPTDVDRVVVTGPAAGPEATADGGPRAVAADAVADPGAGPDPVLGRLDRLDAELAAIRQELAGAHERAAARERIIDRLHEDNQRLRAGEGQLLLRPLLTDLQRLRTDLLRQAAALPAELPAARTAELFESFAHSVELSLERGGVRVLRPLVGEPFDGARHRATGTVPAQSAEQDATVADVLGDGYLDEVTGRALVPAPVRVRRWTPVAPTADPDIGTIPQQPGPGVD